MATLTVHEVRQLTLFKWRYTLGSTERGGFTRQEADRLLFWKWKWQTRREADDR